LVERYADARINLFGCYPDSLYEYNVIFYPTKPIGSRG